MKLGKKYSPQLLDFYEIYANFVNRNIFKKKQILIE